LVIYILFNISNGFWEILKKLFLKEVCQGLGVAKTSWLWSKNVKNICLDWESSLPWTTQSWPCFRKIRGKGVFSRYCDPLYLNYWWTYQNGHGTIRSSLAPFFSNYYLFSKISQFFGNFLFLIFLNIFFPFFRKLFLIFQNFTKFIN